MAIIKSGASTDLLTVDPTSKASRVTLYDSTGRETSFGFLKTYAASAIFTPPATPTDMVKITGSATKTIKIVSFRITTTNTAAGSQQFFLIRRSADNTAGTFINTTTVPLDSTNPAATAIIGHYTANPTALGAVVGTINTTRVASPVAIPVSFAGIKEEASVELLPFLGNANLDQRVVLYGTAQLLVLNFGGVALVAGQTHAYTVVWTEE